MPYKSPRVSRRVKLRIFASYRNPSRPWLQNLIYALTSAAPPPPGSDLASLVWNNSILRNSYIRVGEVAQKSLWFQHPH